VNRVLVADDSLTVRMDLDQAFRSAGWTTVLCSSAAEARAAVRHAPPDCIVLDVLLPDANGIELLRELRGSAVAAPIPVILLSSEPELAERIRDVDVAADAYVGKPYERAYVVSEAQRLAARVPSRPGRAVPLILAVDDSPTYLNELASQLQGEYEIVRAGSGAQALELLAGRSGTPSVSSILLDMLMPGMSGPDVCRRIKGSSQWRAIPVIMLTGREDRQAIFDCFAAGADDYVPKSGDMAVLRARIEAQLRRRQFEQETLEVREELHRKELEVAEANASLAERKRVEEELRAAKISADRAKAAAEEASRAKDHFLAVLSHELRTPLTPVLAAVSLLQRDAALSESARERLELIRRNVELQARLIDDLLDLTRIIHGKVQLDKRRMELCTILERAAEVCRPDIEARRLHFGIDYGPRPYLVEADPGRLQQVFWNLIKNAIKFTPLGGCVGLRCRPMEGHVVIEINDSGIGIEPSAIGRIFDAFAQAELSITRRFGGLGLGLAISRVLVEMHGGTITAASEGENLGATFTVRLPVVDRSAAIDKAQAKAIGPDKADRGLRILLVEDHGDTALVMQSVLEHSGHRVLRAGDVAVALDMAAKNDFDLLVSDLGLPDGSGLDLMRELRARGHKFPAIALSGYGQEKDIAQSAGAGFHMHLVKPVDIDRLLQAVAKAAASAEGA
jgi:DNA-binding response OmpR family regulator